eukprot:COSAG01_NODE_2182_length_8212_cov_7.046838_3_plen_107_part_00
MYNCTRSNVFYIDTSSSLDITNPAYGLGRGETNGLFRVAHLKRASTRGSFEASAYVLSKSRSGRDPAEPSKHVRKIFGRKLRVPEAVVSNEAVGLGRTGNATQHAH